MKVLIKESIISIKKSFKRFLSILLITLLGVGFFAGIRSTSPDMELTINKYYKDTNFMDISLQSTWGVTNKEINDLNSLGYNVEAGYTLDAIVKGDTEEVIKILSYNKNDSINKLILLDGRMPNNNKECVIEQSEYTESHKVGEKILVEDDSLKEKELEIVGIIKSPIYSSLERGSTKLLSGKVNFFMYVPIDNFNIDYYTVAYLKLDYNYNIFNKKYKKLIGKETNNLEKILKQYAINRHNEEVEKATNKLNIEINDLNDKKNTFNIEITKARNELNKARNSYNNAIKELNNTKTTTINDLNNKLSTVNNNLLGLDALKNTLNLKKTVYNDKLIRKTEITTRIDEINDLLLDSNNDIDSLNIELNDLNTELSTIDIELPTLLLEITTEEQTIQAQESALLNNKTIIETNKVTFLNTINNKNNELNNLNKTIQNNEYTLNNKIIDTNNKFKEAEERIKQAKIDISNIETPEWYVLDRSTNLGYYQFSQDIDRISNIGKLFPMVFFIVSILICLTSMTRMVEEERNQLGTLKALGYTNAQIISKYTIYALLATIIGSILGIFIGLQLLPKVIFMMYSMMYNIGNIYIDFNFKYSLLGTIIAILCTVIATLFAAIKELKETPSTLMRPKSPKAGKRVLLEKITIIWKRLSFNRKVTIRNIFRYKKRFLMTIIGISGCTGLIIAGFGLKDCITGMVPSQYEGVYDYQIELTFKDSITDKLKDSEVKRIGNIKGLNEILVLNKESVEITNKDINQAIQLVVPFSNLDGFINLRDRLSKDKYTLGNKVIISEKLARLLNVDINDKLVLKTDKEYKVEVGNITENYMYHYIYMNKYIYNSNYYNTLLIKTNELTTKEQNEISNEIKKNDTISSIVFTSSMRSVFDSTMKNFGYVAGVLIISAGLLAFVVLYNLAYVNISERKRELATIKVLGFYDKEVFNYIGRETTILTIIGMILGIVIGKILTMFIIKTCELDAIMFNTVIEFKSYIYSLLITLFFTILVNVIIYFTLKKVDMIESLKSIE